MVFDDLKNFSEHDEHFMTEELCKNMCFKLFKLQKDGIMCDVKFIKGSVSVPAHSCVLAVASPFLMRYILSRTIFFNDVSGRSYLIIPISVVTKMVNESDDNCINCISKVVQYIYSGNISITNDHFQHIVNISCNLEMDELVAICRRFHTETNSTIDFPKPHFNEHLSCHDDFYKPDFKYNVAGPNLGFKDMLPKRNFSGETEYEKLQSDFKDMSAKSNSGYKGEVIDSYSSCKNLSVQPNPDFKDQSAESDLSCKNMLVDSNSCSKDKSAKPTLNCKVQLSEPNFESSSQKLSDIITETHGTLNSKPSAYSIIKDQVECFIDKKASINNEVCDNLEHSDLSVNKSNLIENKQVITDKISSEIKNQLHKISDNMDILSVCLECNTTFVNADLLKHHMLVFHSNKFNCFYCRYKTHRLTKIIKHMIDTKHGNKCCVCNKECDSNDSFESHVINDHQMPLPFPCGICKLKFKTRYSWKNHLITHKDSNIYRCMCNSYFNSEKALEIHILKSHSEKIKKCNLCSYTSIYSSYLKRHMLKHEKKLISCNFPNCLFKTARKENLKQHLKSHSRTTTKEFICTLCGTCFSLNKNLKRHLLVAHNNLNVYECPECTYTNARFDKIKSHCLTHKNSIDILDKLNEQHIKIRYNLSQEEIAYNTKLNKSGCANITTVLPDLETSVKLGGRSNTLSDRLIESQENSKLSSEDRVVYLNETTGELTCFCDSSGKPLTGVPDVITVHSICGMNNTKHLDHSDSAGVFLNEITGELTDVQINFESNTEISSKHIFSNIEMDVTVLDEATGEITSKSRLASFDKDNIISDFDNIFDSIDFDAMNDDSFDGFDDFDNALFDAEFSTGSVSPDMDNILNEYTGELFTDEAAGRYAIRKGMANESIHHLWQNVQKTPCESVTPMNSQNHEFVIFLNEVTGELTAE